jgi:hypothetical protein
MAKRKRLRKQPKLQRVQAAGTATIPKVVVPSAAKKRKRRNRQRFKLPTVLLKQIAFSARWMSLNLGNRNPGMAKPCYYQDFRGFTCGVVVPEWPQLLDNNSRGFGSSPRK